MTHGHAPPTRRSGQTMVFLLMALTILFVMVLWNFDLHKIVRLKSESQNAGDSGALMAARWQGITLNLVGDLNLFQALALSQGDLATVAAISNVQRRLTFTGPMVAFLASQQAGKNNGLLPNDDFTTFLQEHAYVVRYDYPAEVGPDGELMFPEPYPDAWQDYATMLDRVAADGVVVGPDNARLFNDYGGPHILLMQGFYDAVAGHNWCWFHRNAPGLLDDYSDYTWWPELPPVAPGNLHNSEIYSLRLHHVSTELHSQLLDLEVANAVADARDLDIIPYLTNTIVQWTFYDGGAWDDWEAMDQGGEYSMPLTGPVKPHYNYTGADASVRVEVSASRLTPGKGGAVITNALTWTAGAKPFGFLEVEETLERPHQVALVLPAYHDVRLVPVDAVTDAGSGAFNLEWQRHIQQHLPEYMENGPGDLPDDCYYCKQLPEWENPGFRDDGSDWLDDNSWQCDIVIGGPGGPGGGTYHGH